jgi:hypothetical protein
VYMPVRGDGLGETMSRYLIRGGADHPLVRAMRRAEGSIAIAFVHPVLHQ